MITFAFWYLIFGMIVTWLLDFFIRVSTLTDGPDNATTVIIMIIIWPISLLLFIIYLIELSINLIKLRKK